MSKICRACLKSSPQLYPVHDIEIPVEHLLRRLVPEVYVSVSAHPVICETCYELMHAVHNFRVQCLRTEKLINKYMTETQDTNIYQGNLNLQDVITYWKQAYFAKPYCCELPRPYLAEAFGLVSDDDEVQVIQANPAVVKIFARPSFLKALKPPVDHLNEPQVVKNVSLNKNKVHIKNNSNIESRRHRYPKSLGKYFYQKNYKNRKSEDLSVDNQIKIGSKILIAHPGPKLLDNCDKNSPEKLPETENNTESSVLPSKKSPVEKPLIRVRSVASLQKTYTSSPATTDINNTEDSIIAAPAICNLPSADKEQPSEAVNVSDSRDETPVLNAILAAPPQDSIDTFKIPEVPEIKKKCLKRICINNEPYSNDDLDVVTFKEEALCNEEDEGVTKEVDENPVSPKPKTIASKTSIVGNEFHEIDENPVLPKPITKASKTSIVGNELQDIDENPVLPKPITKASKTSIVGNELQDIDENPVLPKPKTIASKTSIVGNELQDIENLLAQFAESSNEVSTKPDTGQTRQQPSPMEEEVEPPKKKRIYTKHVTKLVAPVAQSNLYCGLRFKFTPHGDYISDHDYLLSPYDINHMKVKRPMGYSMWCLLCNTTQATIKHASHMRKHHSKCMICKVDFRNVFLLNMHVKKHFFSCSDCEKTITYAEYLPHFHFHYNNSLSSSNSVDTPTLTESETLVVDNNLTSSQQDLARVTEEPFIDNFDNEQETVITTYRIQRDNSEEINLGTDQISSDEMEFRSLADLFSSSSDAIIDIESPLINHVNFKEPRTSNKGDSIASKSRTTGNKRNMKNETLIDKDIAERNVYSDLTSAEKTAGVPKIKKEVHIEEGNVEETDIKSLSESISEVNAEKIANPKSNKSPNKQSPSSLYKSKEKPVTKSIVKKNLDELFIKNCPVEESNLEILLCSRSIFEEIADDLSNFEENIPEEVSDKIYSSESISVRNAAISQSSKNKSEKETGTSPVNQLQYKPENLEVPLVEKSPVEENNLEMLLYSRSIFEEIADDLTNFEENIPKEASDNKYSSESISVRNGAISESSRKKSEEETGESPVNQLQYSLNEEPENMQKPLVEKSPGKKNNLEMLLYSRSFFEDIVDNIGKMTELNGAENISQRASDKKYSSQCNLDNCKKRSNQESKIAVLNENEDETVTKLKVKLAPDACNLNELLNNNPEEDNDSTTSVEKFAKSASSLHPLSSIFPEELVKIKKLSSKQKSPILVDNPNEILQSRLDDINDPETHPLSLDNLLEEIMKISDEYEEIDSNSSSQSELDDDIVNIMDDEESFQNLSMIDIERISNEPQDSVIIQEGPSVEEMPVELLGKLASSNENPEEKVGKQSCNGQRLSKSASTSNPSSSLNIIESKGPIEKRYSGNKSPQSVFNSTLDLTSEPEISLNAPQPPVTEEIEKSSIGCKEAEPNGSFVDISKQGIEKSVSNISDNPPEDFFLNASTLDTTEKSTDEPQHSVNCQKDPSNELVKYPEIREVEKSPSSQRLAKSVITSSSSTSLNTVQSESHSDNNASHSLFDPVTPTSRKRDHQSALNTSLNTSQPPTLEEIQDVSVAHDEADLEVFVVEIVKQNNPRVSNILDDIEEPPVECEESDSDSRFVDILNVSSEETLQNYSKLDTRPQPSSLVNLQEEPSAEKSPDKRLLKSARKRSIKTLLGNPKHVKKSRSKRRLAKFVSDSEPPSIVNILQEVKNKSYSDEIRSSSVVANLNNTLLSVFDEPTIDNLQKDIEEPPVAQEGCDLVDTLNDLPKEFSTLDTKNSSNESQASSSVNFQEGSSSVKQLPKSTPKSSTKKLLDNAKPVMRPRRKRRLAKFFSESNPPSKVNNLQEELVENKSCSAKQESPLFLANSNTAVVSVFDEPTIDHLRKDNNEPPVAQEGCDLVDTDDVPKESLQNSSTLDTKNISNEQQPSSSVNLQEESSAKKSPVKRMPKSTPKSSTKKVLDDAKPVLRPRSKRRRLAKFVSESNPTSKVNNLQEELVENKSCSAKQGSPLFLANSNTAMVSVFDEPTIDHLQKDNNEPPVAQEYLQNSSTLDTKNSSNEQQPSNLQEESSAKKSPVERLPKSTPKSSTKKVLGNAEPVRRPRGKRRLGEVNSGSKPNNLQEEPVENKSYSDDLRVLVGNLNNAVRPVFDEPAVDHLKKDIKEPPVTQEGCDPKETLENSSTLDTKNTSNEPQPSSSANLQEGSSVKKSPVKRLPKSTPKLSTRKLLGNPKIKKTQSKRKLPKCVSDSKPPPIINNLPEKLVENKSYSDEVKSPLFIANLNKALLSVFDEPTNDNHQKDIEEPPVAQEHCDAKNILVDTSNDLQNSSSLDIENSSNEPQPSSSVNVQEENSANKPQFKRLPGSKSKHSTKKLLGNPKNVKKPQKKIVNGSKPPPSINNLPEKLVADTGERKSPLFVANLNKALLSVFDEPTSDNLQNHVSVAQEEISLDTLDDLPKETVQNSSTLETEPQPSRSNDPQKEATPEMSPSKRVRKLTYKCISINASSSSVNLQKETAVKKPPVRLRKLPKKFISNASSPPPTIVKQKKNEESNLEIKNDIGRSQEKSKNLAEKKSKVLSGKITKKNKAKWLVESKETIVAESAPIKQGNLQTEEPQIVSGRKRKRGVSGLDASDTGVNTKVSEENAPTLEKIDIQSTETTAKNPINGTKSNGGLNLVEGLADAPAPPRKSSRKSLKQSKYLDFQT